MWWLFLVIHLETLLEQNIPVIGISQRMGDSIVYCLMSSRNRKGLDKFSVSGRERIVGKFAQKSPEDSWMDANLQQVVKPSAASIMFLWLWIVWEKLDVSVMILSPLSLVGEGKYWPLWEFIPDIYVYSVRNTTRVMLRAVQFIILQVLIFLCIL